MGKKARRGWGEGRVYQLPSGRWRAVISIGKAQGGGRVREGKTFDKKQEAVDWLAQRKAGGSVASGTAWTVARWCDHWLEAKKREKEHQTWRFYNQRVKNHVKPYLGTLRLNQVTKVVVDDWHGKMTADGVSPAQQLRAAKTLRAALEAAFRSGLIPTNPTKRAALPRVRTKEMQAWSRDQARTFLEAVKGDRYEAAWWLLLDSGMRPGELLALTWQEIDLEAGTVRVRRALEYTDKGFQLKPPKTAKGNRVILLAPATVEKLRARPRTGELVFPAPRGGYLRPDYLNSRYFAPIVAILSKSGIPTIRLYDLRHTCATLLLGNGVNIRVVADRLGHEDPRVTLRHYSHAIPSLQEQARTAIQDLLG